jgi:hypothetical protein
VSPLFKLRYQINPNVSLVISNQERRGRKSLCRMNSSDPGLVRNIAHHKLKPRGKGYTNEIAERTPQELRR